VSSSNCAEANAESTSPRSGKRAIEDADNVIPPAKRTKTAKEEKLEKKLKLRAKRSIKAKHAQDMSLVTLKNADKRKVTLNAITLSHNRPDTCSSLQVLEVYI